MTSQTQEKSIATKPATLKEILGDPKTKNRFNEILGKKAPAFISSIISAVQANAELGKADPASIVAAAAVAASLDLPINGSLGFAALVPYKKNSKTAQGWTESVVAQFQIMSRGFVQLAQRTGQYKTMAVSEVYEGQLKGENPITGEYEFDHKGKVSDTVIGYVFYFKLINGFEKYTYMTVDEVKAHGKKFSKSYESEKGMWKQNFPVMALKTVVKRGLSKWGPLSTEMQKAATYDQAAVTEDGNPDYIDATTVEGEQEAKKYALPEEKNDEQTETKTEAPAQPKEHEVVFEVERGATATVGGLSVVVLTGTEGEKVYIAPQDLQKKAKEFKKGVKASALVNTVDGKDWAKNLVAVA